MKAQMNIDNVLRSVGDAYPASVSSIQRCSAICHGISGHINNILESQQCIAMLWNYYDYILPRDVVNDKNDILDNTAIIYDSIYW